VFTDEIGFGDNRKKEKRLITSFSKKNENRQGNMSHTVERTNT